MANLNPEEAFRSLKTRAENAVRSHFPIEGKEKRLELLSVSVEDDTEGPSSRFHVDNIESQLNTKLKGGTWAVPLQARIRLVEKASGKVLDEREVVLGRIPKLTRRYSFIVEGHERQHDSVFRLQSRPFHRYNNRGDLLAAWNLKSGNNFDITMNPNNGIFMVNFKGSNSVIPIYALLIALGVSDSQMISTWGKEIYDANRAAAKVEKNLISLRTALKGTKTKDPVPYIREQFDRTQVRPDAMENAFGVRFTKVNGEALLLSTARLVKILKGEEPEDDRESLASKDIASTEDYIAEAIETDKATLQKIKKRIDDPDIVKITDLVQTGLFNRAILSKFKTAQRPDQTNPLNFVSGYLRATSFGEAFGGVKSERAITDRDKFVHPSHLAFIDPVQTPEGEDTGITLHLALGVKKDGTQLKIKVWDVKAGRMVEVTAAFLEKSVVAFPDQVRWKDGKPVPTGREVVVYDRDLRTTKRPWSEVTHVLVSSKGLFSFSANMVPFLQNDQGNRAMMAAKQQEQAVSLVNREIPLVQSKTEGKSTFDAILGAFNSFRSPVSGTITEVLPSAILIKENGTNKVFRVQIYDNFPLNGGKSALHAEPKVKVGDSVQKGQLIADTNFTRDGNFALGSNLRVAYIPYKGLNFEDGIVVSETAAKKMTSFHVHSSSLTVFPSMLVDKNLWRDYALPERATPERLEKLDASGIIKEGQIVKPGDILVAALSRNRDTKEREALATIHKSLVREFKDSSLVWDNDHAGTVVRIVKVGAPGTKNGMTITVQVRTNEPLIVGDKLSGRHGNKGIVSRILPDHEMPKDKDGNPVEVLLSPAGVPSRINPGQILEAAASKIALKTGKPYTVDNFRPNTDYAEKVLKDLKENGLSDTEELFDPETGRSLGQVLTGNPHLIKLHHMVDHKMTARSYGGSYSQNGDAIAGSGIPGGGQSLDQLTMYAMLAHGAHHNLREAQTYKSDVDQSAVWAAIQTGSPLPPPQPSRGMKNFLGYLRASGINVEKKDDVYEMSPLTDAHVKKFSNGEIKTSKTLYAKGHMTIEESAGLFDKNKTGGMDGDKWTHFELPLRMPNPVFEKPILSLLGLTEPQFAKLVSSEGLAEGKTGFQEIVDRLAAIDVKKELKATEEKMAKQTGTALNKSYAKVKYLRTLDSLGMSPVEAYTNKLLPVLPPKMRRVSIGLDGSQIFDPANWNYRAVSQASARIKELHPSTPIDARQKFEAHLYDAIKGLRMQGMDLGGLAGKKRHYAGIMEKLEGTEPKHSFFQDGVLSRRQDLSGRSTIVPETTLGLDEVGVPLPIAVEMFKPFVIRELHTQYGYSKVDALRMIKTKEPVVIQALERVMSERPVMMKRDPALHKYSIMGFRPRLVSGKAIRIHPLVTTGFNADFDGDTVALYVPVSDQARDEVLQKMLPSKNLLSPTHGNPMNMPTQDALLGLYQITRWGTDIGKTFANRAEAIKAFRDQKVKGTDVITVEGKKTTAARLDLAEDLPLPMRNDSRLLYDPKFILNKNELTAIFKLIAKEYPADYAKTADRWKDKGNLLAYLHGSSFSIKDFHDGKEVRDQVLAPYRRQEEVIRKNTSLTPEQKDKQIVALYAQANDQLKRVGEQRYAGAGNKVYDWKESGAKGNWNQFKQMVFGPLLVDDPKGNAVPVPLLHSFGEGLTVAEYWAHMNGARKGALDRSQETREPGSLTKDLINTVINTHVTAEDCGTTNGLRLSPQDEKADIVDRYLGEDVRLPDGTVFARNTLITPAVLTRIRNAESVKEIEVRSPFFCKQPKGICAKCYGLNEDGKSYSVGTNVGVIAGHALGEPVTQMTMRTFHTGGASGASGGITNYFQRAKNLFHVPKKIPNEAVIAPESGVIRSLKPNTAIGGWDAEIGATSVHFTNRQKPLQGVDVGVQVTAGQKLSEGDVNPHHLFAVTKDIKAVRNLIASDLMELYPGDARRRNIETVIRAMTNVTQVNDPGDFSEYIRGQMAPLAEVEEKNRTAGSREKIKHTPQLKPMTQVPLLGTEDWLARLNYRHLGETYREGAAQGWKSDIHDHPIAGLAHGAEFGFKRRDKK